MATEKAGKAGQVPTAMTNYTKSNFLISGKYKASLLENKLMAISLAKSSEFDFGESADSPVYSRIRVSEIRKLVGGNNGSFYRTIRDTAEAMTGRTIGMTSQDSKTFDYIAIVTRAHCEDGIFTIEYNHAIKEYLVDITKNFTRLNLPVMLQFKSIYSFRLYELLKSKCYRTKEDPAGPADPYYVTMDLNELRLELGVVNANDTVVKKALRGSKRPDYTKAVAVAQEKTFTSWPEFNRKVLRVACEEINRSSDMQVHYQPEGAGRGGKVVQLHFTILLTQAGKAAGKEREGVQRRKERSEEEMFAIVIELGALFQGEFTPAEIHTIAEEADYELPRIETAFHVYQQAGEVDNPVGFMIAAIREGYTVSGKGGRAGSGRAQGWNDAAGERYPLSAVKDMIGYDGLLEDDSLDPADLDAFVNVIYDTLNSTQPTIRVMREDKPAAVVQGVFAKLDASDVRFAVDQLNVAGYDGVEITNFDSYARTLLYRARDQRHLSMMNQGHVNGDF